MLAPPARPGPHALEHGRRRSSLHGHDRRARAVARRGLGAQRERSRRSRRRSRSACSAPGAIAGCGQLDAHARERAPRRRPSRPRPTRPPASPFAPATAVGRPRAGLTLRRSTTSVSGSGRVRQVRHRVGGLDGDGGDLAPRFRGDGFQVRARRHTSPPDGGTPRAGTAAISPVPTLPRLPGAASTPGGPGPPAAHAVRTRSRHAVCASPSFALVRRSQSLAHLALLDERQRIVDFLDDDQPLRADALDRAVEQAVVPCTI